MSSRLQVRRIQGGDFCSQNRAPRPEIRSIEEGVKFIEKVLNEPILCRHDVQNINQTFQDLDQLERKITVIPAECSSKNALEKIIEKIKILVSSTAVDRFISLYHLQNFSVRGLPDLPIDKCFSKKQREFPKSSENAKEIASTLPHCRSVAEYDQDAEILIGPDRTSEVSVILEQNRAELKNNARLNRLRERAYPSYFQELLEKGYTHLFDHLIEMGDLRLLNAKRNTIEKMSFSEVAHVILETREAILEKSKHFFCCTGSKNILFLLGRSGSGKTVAFCYLRGDRIVQKGSRYESEREPGLIGHDEKRSCTFLPAVAETTDWVIVDFPGFENSNGLLIKLGLELALKTLIQQYHPKILVLEAITNRDGKFANAAALGRRLERLLGDSKENCVLGITRYSEDPDAIEFKDLLRQEEEYKKPSPKQSECLGEIRTLSALGMVDPSKKAQEKFDGMQQKRNQERESLDYEGQKAACQKRLGDRENELLKQIGLTGMIRFDLLESPLNPPSLCFQKLSDPSSARPPGSQLPVKDGMEECLDPEDKNLLEYLLVNKLLKDMKIKDGNQIESEEIKTFERKILESTLSQAVSTQVSPEISEFLGCLQTIDSQFVQKYERKIVREHINRYIHAIISTFDISLIDRMLRELKTEVNKKHLSRLEKLKIMLRDYILSSLGINLPLNAEQTNIKWDELQKRHQKKVDLVPAGFLHGGERLLARNNAIETTLNEYITKLNNIYNDLLILRGLKLFVEKRNNINNAFESVVINATSLRTLFDSIKLKISRVRDAFGIEEWDRRVASIADGEIIKNLESSKINIVQYIHYIFIYTYHIIEPDVEIAEFENLDVNHTTYFIVAVGKKPFSDLKEKTVEHHRVQPAEQSEKFDLKIKLKNDIFSLMLKGNKEELKIGLNINLNGESFLIRALIAAAVLKSLEASNWYENLRNEELIYRLFQ